ncbi:MAG: dTDP-4-dehydrorhamnose reductase [Oxalicibacterium faecigallinarum]|uniref:dTDP-4-dehydrorhamnose reductase n=1 Tax=Oxalicibacterium faecigallinarum TaxID=573741 RepID=UPI0028075AB4|nr:dTDP-4-dehydrorhamnose reductase [Oxalicibacterium faecigallinarum]MDQ7969637.1 dTDP-4-dehydrorhamnose reductase [Oxalicibacterium faecigallinarum]
MKILLFGKNGQVGWELQRSLASLGHLISLDANSRDYCGDFLQPEGLKQTVLQLRPDVIVNAAAHTAVDKAETESAIVRTVNAVAPGVLAQVAEQVGALLVHYSTDYVFDGSGETPWQEDDVAVPLNVYGQTKLESERLVSQYCSRHLIFRTSWVYGARGGNFAKTMLRMAQERDSLSVINDQFGAPTGADLLADITAHAILQALHSPEKAGLYHLVAGGCTTWHGYAAFVIEQALRMGVRLKATGEKIQAVPTIAFQTAATRPHNSRLNTRKLQQTFGLVLPQWQTGVLRMLQEISGINGYDDEKT